MKKKVEEMLKMGVIKQSQQYYHSQVLLTPKPDGSWRFCVDYRYLNSIMEKMGWPLPNIREITSRIGQSSPVWFGKMDLVKGYYQGSMAQSSSWLTAFITPFGTFEWNRIAMGLSVAPSWFQQQIQEEVLGGLVGTTVEHYIDDLLVYDQTEEGFLEKLKTLFERLQEKNIYLNPSKCAFGLKKIQFLGYEYEEGQWSMPEYPKPRLAGQLKSFLGITSYFHEFIKNHASIQTPLEKMISGYKKAKSKEVLVWTPEAEEAFLKIRDAINKCPKLHYIDEGKQLILQSDASNYGIGAILFQKGRNDSILPVAFYSTTLSSHVLYWAVNEKEAYAIIAAVKHWESLLSGRRFLIETDHRNLIYISQSCSPKVIRWNWLSKNSCLIQMISKEKRMKLLISLVEFLPKKKF
jgi:hypothetical protein